MTSRLDVLSAHASWDSLSDVLCCNWAARHDERDPRDILQERPAYNRFYEESVWEVFFCVFFICIPSIPVAVALYFLMGSPPPDESAHFKQVASIVLLSGVVLMCVGPAPYIRAKGRHERHLANIWQKVELFDTALRKLCDWGKATSAELAEMDEQELRSFAWEILVNAAMAHRRLTTRTTEVSTAYGKELRRLDAELRDKFDTLADGFGIVKESRKPYEPIFREADCRLELEEAA